MKGIQKIMNDGRKNVAQENIYMLWICGASVLILFFARYLKFIFRFFIRAGFSLALIYLANILFCNILDMRKICVGINFITAFITGLLGLPGVISLYVAKSIL